MTFPAPGIRTNLSNSGASCFRDCQRKYQYRYEMDLQRIWHDAHALHFGRLFHAAIAEWSIYRSLAAAISWIDTQGCAEDDCRYVRAMLVGYQRRWADDTPPMLCEQEFSNQICNPLTWRRSRKFLQFGIYDAVALHADGVWLWERKTTSSLGNNLEKLWCDSQITGYYVALIDAGIPVRGVVYDQVLKTKIRQKKTESIEDYYRRRDALYLDTPDMYHREVAYIGQQQIADWRYDMWQTTQGILNCRRQGHWPRNTSRCYDYYSQCEFAPLCQSGGNPILIENEYQNRTKAKTSQPKALAF